MIFASIISTNSILIFVLRAFFFFATLRSFFIRFSCIFDFHSFLIIIILCFANNLLIINFSLIINLIFLIVALCLKNLSLFGKLLLLMLKIILLFFKYFAMQLLFVPIVVLMIFLFRIRFLLLIFVLLFIKLAAINLFKLNFRSEDWIDFSSNFSNFSILFMF